MAWFIAVIALLCTLGESVKITGSEAPSTLRWIMAWRYGAAVALGAIAAALHAVSMGWLR